MHVIRDPSALAHLRDSEVRGLIDRRVQEIAEYVETDFSELVFFVVVEPGDALDAVDVGLGLSLMSNRFDDTAYGGPDFTPSWDVLEEHAGCYELVFVLSDDGSGVTVFVLKSEGVPAELLAMCAEYATPVKEGAGT